MSALTVKRIIVWTISMGLGFAISWLIVTLFLPAVSPDPNAEAVSIGEYGRLYFLVTMVPLGLVFVCWLDYFMDTKILPD